jgi:hypothetical protein
MLNDRKVVVQRVVGCGGPAAFVFFVFACVALTHSDRDSVYQACGTGLRDWVMADLIVSIFFWVIPCIFAFCISACIFNTAGAYLCTLIPFVGAFVLCVCFSCYTLINASQAMNNPDCTSALSGTVEGINSPLLAYIGYLYGSLYAVAALPHLVAVIAVLCLGPWLVTVVD